MAPRNKSVKTPRAQQPGVPPADQKRPLLIYLKGILASLNPTDRLIADCVLSDPEKVITSTIAEIKYASGASVGSIVSFCHHLGLKGFADFKITLARDLAQSGLPAGGGADAGSLLEKVFHFHAQCLVETLQINPRSTFERVAQVLEKARAIEFFSIGLSYPVAFTAYGKLRLIGLPASVQVDSHMQLITATQLKAGDVAFGISCSGTTRETVECMEVAKANGATTIGLTNAMKSPITAYSDLCLYATPSEIKYFQAPLASRITQLAVIDALFVSLVQKHKNRTAAHLQHSGEELIKRRWI
jgi:RpiR family transcriptional regulator, carbohydrate utilization regulator